MDDIEISRASLNWTTINITGTKQSNKPGVLAQLAGLVSKVGGNIVRSVNNTKPDGGFYLRLIIEGMDFEMSQYIQDSFWKSEIEFEIVELV